MSDLSFPRPEPPTAWQFAAAVGRSWAVVLLATVLTAGTALALSVAVLPKEFSSQATLLVNPAPETTSSTAPTFFVDDQSVGKTFEELAKQPVVASSVAAELGVGQEVPSRHVVVHAVPKTPLLQITYTAGSPGAATRGARAYSIAFLQALQRGQWLKADATIVSPATTVPHQTAPRPLLNALVGGLAGCLVAVGGVCLVLQARSARDRAGPDQRLGPPLVPAGRVEPPVPASRWAGSAPHVRRGGA